MEILTILEKLEARCDIKFEVISGKIVPKEASEPLPDDVLELLLTENLDSEQILNFYKMANTSYNHKRIIAELTILIGSQLNSSKFAIFINELEIKRSFLRSFLIPDLAFTLSGGTLSESKTALENPISIIEVLSPSTEKKDRNEKKEAYQSIESLQEYVLIAQDSYKIEQYLRQGKTKWTVKVYDKANETCVLTVGVKIKLNDLYKNTDWAKKD
jgi:Uma2 family endonuclease